MFRMVLQNKEGWLNGLFDEGFGWTPDYDGVRFRPSRILESLRWGSFM